MNMENMKKYVYVLCRKATNKDTGKTFYYYFNSTFVEHKIIFSQIFLSVRWYETVESCKIEKVEEGVLDWTAIIYFNRITIHIARLFALFKHKEWYKIQKVEVVASTDTDTYYYN
jgi:hypothetical protein